MRDVFGWVLAGAIAGIPAIAVAVSDCEYYRKEYPVSSTPAMTETQLSKFLEDNAFASKAKFLEALSKDAKYRGLLGNYTLIQQSHSLQPSPLEIKEGKVVRAEPRVVLFGGDGTLILAMSGDESDKSVEVQSFDRATKTWNFSRIDFPYKDKSSHKKGRDFAMKNCAGCHGEKLTPRWASYLFWDGAFGGGSNRIIDDSIEAKAWEKYSETAPTHPVYKHLPAQKTRRIAKLPFLYFNQDQPNQLAIFLAELSRQRVASELAKADGHEQRKFAVLGALLQCEKLDRFIDKEAGKKRKSFTTFDKLKADAEAKIDKDFQSRVAKAKDFHGDILAIKRGPHSGVYALFTETGEATRVAGLQFALQGTKTNVSDWLLDRNGLNLASDGRGSSKTLHCEYWPLVRNDPDFADIRRKMDSYDSDTDKQAICDFLEARSVKAYTFAEEKTAVPRNGKESDIRLPSPGH